MQASQLAKTGRAVTCTNEDCQYSWEYRGKSIFYATCPMCRTAVKLEKKESQAGDLEGRQQATVETTDTRGGND